KCHQLCLKILQALAIALELPQSEGGKHWFEPKHNYDLKSGDWFTSSSLSSNEILPHNSTEWVPVPHHFKLCDDDDNTKYITAVLPTIRLNSNSSIPLGIVNTGMLIPIAKVSIANRTLNSNSTISLKAVITQNDE
ncbi:19387_t:CDS:2, partial [Gigaspora rosea]